VEAGEGSKLQVGRKKMTGPKEFLQHPIVESPLQVETEEGKVIKVEGNKMIVWLSGGSQCTHCAAREACRALAGGGRQIELPKINGIKPGSRVIIRYKSRSRVFSAFVVFILPLLFLIGGYITFDALFRSEGQAILGSLLGLLLGFLIARLIDRLVSHRSEFLPEVLGIEL